MKTPVTKYCTIRICDGKKIMLKDLQCASSFFCHAIELMQQMNF
jgi:hypothetical protein